MCLEELLLIFKTLELYDEHFVERDVNIAFNLSKMLEVDEISTDKASQLHMVEFYEALARIAEKASPPPFGSNYRDFPYSVRFLQPLHIKLEGLFLTLLNMCDNHMKAMFKVPAQSIFTVKEEIAEDSD